MSFNRVATVGLMICGLALAGCKSTKAALGMNKVVPDEFAVVTQAPLVVPPDYSLRPPTPGEPRPQELQPESQARLALLNERSSATRSEGETLLAQKAGADKADPLIRYVVDDEFGSIAHKEPSFADRVIFWRKHKPDTQGQAYTAAQAGADSPAPIDPKIEADRVQKLTGGQEVVIAREPDKHLKLPGL
jgi:hypothetical protein